MYTQNVARRHSALLDSGRRLGSFMSQVGKFYAAGWEVLCGGLGGFMVSEIFCWRTLTLYTGTVYLTNDIVPERKCVQTVQAIINVTETSLLFTISVDDWLLAL